MSIICVLVCLILILSYVLNLYFNIENPNKNTLDAKVNVTNSCMEQNWCQK